MYMTMYEVSLYLGIDEVTVRNWARNFLARERGEDVEGPCLPVLGGFWVDEATLPVFVEENRDAIEQRRENLLSS